MFSVNAFSFLILCVFTFVFFSFKMTAVFQQCGYRLVEFFSAIFGGKKKEICRLSTYSLVFFVVLAINLVLFNREETTFSLFLAVSTIILALVYFLTTKTVKRAKLTHRCFRVYLISLASCALFCLASFCLTYSVCATPFKNYGCLSIFSIPLLIPLFLAMGKIVNAPYDFLRYVISKSICKKRLSKNCNLIKIGITGSSGKTSLKNYLAKMLETKYRVLASPRSFNTPLGICLTAKGGVENYDVFIAEMGARYKNDIKELCNIVKPNIGVITSILPQHTKTLGGIIGVKKAKYQLIDGLYGQKASFFYNDESHLFDLYQKTDIKKFLVGKGGVVYYQNAVQRSYGIDFELVIGEKTYKAFTPLIGFHNLENVCMATAIALYLKVDVAKILSVIQTLTPPKHRAQIIRTDRGITVIDDSYNANVQGVKSTANAVSNMGGNKIAVTSGIVELGKEVKDINREVGKILAKNFSLVIATGVNSDHIKEGVLLEKGNVLVLENMQSIKDYLSAQLKGGDVVAFFNDLPDVYGI